MRAIARRLILPHVLLAAVIVAAALWFVLYGMKGGDGKETRRPRPANAPRLDRAGAETGAAGQGRYCRSRRPRRAAAHAGADFFGQRRGRSNFRLLQGANVLLNLWATWCVPCREEMPALDRLQGAGRETAISRRRGQYRHGEARAAQGFPAGDRREKLGISMPIRRPKPSDVAAKRQGGRTADNFPDRPRWLRNRRHRRPRQMGWRRRPGFAQGGGAN